MGPIAKAFFLDTPSLIDSAWRHIDYWLNAECDYRYAQNPPVLTRPFWHKPPFWFFAITVFFVSYGPTWDGLCAIVPKDLAYLVRQLFAAAVLFGSLYLAYKARPALRDIVRHRFDGLGNELTNCRKAAVVFIASVAFLLLPGIGLGAAYYLHLPSDIGCGVPDWNGVAVARFLMCVAAIVGFAAIARCPGATIKRLLLAQGAILALIALVQWFGLVPLIEWLKLAPAPVREASDLPYRHVFEAWAPCIVAILILAPCLARRALAPGTGVSLQVRDRFRDLLTAEELFVRPTDPDSSWRRIRYAITYGPAYHPLHLLLLPSLVALVTAAQWLYLAVCSAFVISFFLLVWGNVSSRWQQLNTYIERWFLRGTPLLISLLVIVVAVLRVVQFDYVSTVLDAAPFGFVFGLILMNYVLFWLVEYWMSRAVAAQLLHVLGNNVEDEVCIPYAPTFANPQGGVQVVRQRRFLLSHDTGRFVVVGAVGDLGPLAGQGQPSTPHTPLVTAFQSYYLMELFARLGESTGNPQNHEDVTEINQRAGMFFFRMNLMIAAVTALFAGAFIYEENFANNAIDPVASVRAAPPTDQAVDLAKLLQQQPGQPVRPAIVVVGSGGGTRAALYTASVLNGLHRLGVDRDIVLLSGVSGGGVALAYFAANRDALTAQGPPRPTAQCPSGEWDCFNTGVTKPFIEDVLNGAAEWRLLRKTALSQLLVESFERHLFTSQPHLGSLNGAALILNSAIVSHPDRDSDVLKRTLDPTNQCDEAERTYNLMGGGRLIFTNLRDTDAFPQPPSPIPDVRLPYQIVRDADVPLAAAAALNANFPPVFPNARVRIHSDGSESCKDSSYYVTDGGAVENLGLVSALYALKSALDTLAKTPGAAVRPIHVVIAEASAVSYDYKQDRGLSALLGGSKERLTGGLTNELIAEINLQLRQPARANPGLHFHYLALPLAFRARGGFGTHWMYAKEYHLNDPRPRTTSWLNVLPLAWFREGKATVDRKELEALWLALHDPDKSFCTTNLFKKDSNAAKVQSWVCGPPPVTQGRDLHMEKWQELVDAMRQYRTP